MAKNSPKTLLKKYEIFVRFPFLGENMTGFQKNEIISAGE